MKKENKACSLNVRVTASQKKMLKTQANKLGISISALVQMILKMVIE